VKAMVKVRARVKVGASFLWGRLNIHPNPKLFGNNILKDDVVTASNGSSPEPIHNSDPKTDPNPTPQLLEENLLKDDIVTAASGLDCLLDMFTFKCDFDLQIDLLNTIKERWMGERSPHEGEQPKLHEVILFEIFRALFAISDADQSEDIDVEEFLKCMKRLGKTNISAAHASRLMSEHDLDHSHTINANEFSMIMVR
jgi:hypothetical protein